MTDAKILALGLRLKPYLKSNQIYLLKYITST